MSSKFIRETAIWLAAVLGAGVTAAQPRAQSQPAMRMYVFNCATLKDRDPDTYNLRRDQVQAVDMSDPCFLIVHPRGTLLWETGLNDAIYNRPEGGGPKHDKIDKSLKSQLAQVGYQPSNITYLAISHAHADHSGNVNDYAGSTWIVQKTERDFMFGNPAPPIKPEEFSALKNSKTMVIEGDHDVFGDGAVMLLSTPGHTPGHQCLLVRLPKTGPVILTGDLYHFPGERTFHTLPRADNQEQTTASRVKIEALLQKTKAQLWIQHDIIGNAKIKKSPAYYN